MKNKKGFTLIELLVVISVIIILSIVVIFFLERAIESAEEAKINAEASQLKKHIEMQGITSTPEQMETMIGNLETEHDYIVSSKYSETNQSFCFDYLINNVSWCTDKDNNSIQGSCDITEGENEGRCSSSTIQSYSLTINITGNGSVTLNGESSISGESYSYTEHTTVEVIPISEEGHEFVGWDGACGGTNPNLCSVTMDSDKTVTAVFTAEQQIILAITKNTGEGSTSPSVGVYTHDYGETVSVTAIPDTGYEFAGWAGACSGADPNNCSVTMDSNKTITANFNFILPTGSSYAGGKIARRESTYILIAASSDISTGAEWGCYGDTTGATSTTNGQTNTTTIVNACGTAGITAKLCDNYSVNVGDVTYDDWYLPARNELHDKIYPNRVAIGGFTDSSYWSSTEEDSNNTWYVSFNDGSEGYGNKSFSNNVRCVRQHYIGDKYALTIEKTGEGTTSPSVGGVHTYNYGQTVSVTATPATDYTFARWSGDCSGAGACSVTMNNNKTVTANFATEPEDLTINIVGEGTTSPSVGIHTYEHGETVLVTATPAINYHFTGWDGACSGTGTCSVTMDGSKNVTANFSIDQYTLTIGKSGEGTISPLVGVHTYNYGEIVPITATPATTGYIAHWIGSCSGTGACSVTMNNNKTVTATFAPPIGGSFGGGKVARINSTYILIAASSDNSTGIQWGCHGKSINIEDVDGPTNTANIVSFHNGWASPFSTLANAGAGNCHTSNNGTVAAKLCDNYNGGGYSDWYLPDSIELRNGLWLNVVAIGGFNSQTPYWSSTESWYDDDDDAVYGYIRSGDEYYSSNHGDKSRSYRVRCVRRHTEY